MYKLSELANQNPDIKEINLDYQNIRDLTLAMNDLRKFPWLRSLSLHGNQLEMLPLLFDLKQLNELDITKNNIKVDSYLLDSLYTLTKLQKLSLDGNSADMERILENLPNLQTLNGKKVIRKKLELNRVQYNKTKLRFLKDAKQQLKKMGEKVCEKFESFDNDFGEVDEMFREISVQFNEFTSNVTNQEAKQGVFYYSKNRILDIVCDKIRDTLEQNGLQHCADAFMQANSIRKQYFDALFRIILQIGYKQNYLEKEFVGDGNSEMNKVRLRKQRLYLKQIMRMKKYVNDLKSQIKKLEEENNKYVSLFYTYARDDKQSAPLQSRRITPRQNLERSSRGAKFLQNYGEGDLGNINLTSNKSRSLTPSKSQPRMGSGTFMHQLNLPAENRRIIIDSQPGTLTFEQTYNLMQQIVKEKQNYNTKCLTKKEPFETTEQFLSIFFMRKYGLKSLAVNSSLSFIKALSINSKKRTEFQVFLKILKNNLEQSFYQEHKQFSRLIRKEVPSSIRKMKRNNQYFSTEIIFYKYFPNEKIQEFNLTLLNNIESPQQLQNLEQELCKIHIKIHEKSITQFLNIFQEFDTDESGVLSFINAKAMVTEFFQVKLKQGIISETILDKVEKRFNSLKNKRKIVFSELVEIVDKI